MATKRPAGLDGEELLSFHVTNRCEVTKTGCWKQLSSLTSDGYPKIRWNNKDYYTHRLFWSKRHNQKFPKNLHARHLCNTSSCCNPAHIEPGTAKENAADKGTKEVRNQSGFRARPVSSTLWETHGIDAYVKKQQAINCIVEQRSEEVSSPCILYSHATDKGYARCNLRKDGKRFKVGLHVLSYGASQGLSLEKILEISADKSIVLRHSCNQKNCCNSEHLSLGTHSENAIDARKAGSKANKGTTEEKVLEVLEAYKKSPNTFSRKEWADKLNISMDAISNYTTGRRYTDLYNKVFNL